MMVMFNVKFVPYISEFIRSLRHSTMLLFLILYWVHVYWFDGKSKCGMDRYISVVKLWWDILWPSAVYCSRYQTFFMIIIYEIGNTRVCSAKGWLQYGEEISPYNKIKKVYFLYEYMRFFFFTYEISVWCLVTNIILTCCFP